MVCTETKIVEDRGKLMITLSHEQRDKRKDGNNNSPKGVQEGGDSVSSSGTVASS